MARKYPKFLFSNPSNTKSSGPFVVHTLEPRFIVKPEFDEKRNLYHTSLVDVWAEDYDDNEVRDIIKEIPQWFNHSGRLQSNHEDDRLIIAVHQLEFLLDYQSPFSVHQTRQLIRTLFPTKSKSIYRMRNSYGFNNFFEQVSMNVIGSRSSAHKSCDNDTVKEAFEKEGYSWEQDGPNRFVNITEEEAKRANRLFKF